jgi:DNA end-binding protein Ku
MPARAYWSGQLRLALVSIPVEIYSAAKSAAAISFRQIHEPSGKPVKYEKVVPGIGPVDPDEIMKGFEYEKGNYVLLDEQELEDVRLESRKTLELTQFVGADEIDAMYYEKPYFVVPADDLAEEAFRVLRDAMRQTRKVGLGQLALRGRETICALKPCGRGILMETLRYAEEVNKAQSYFRSISNDPSPSELLELATALIERRSAPFDAAAFKDHYQDALREVIERKLRDRGTSRPQPKPDEPEARTSNVVDLMAALKRSLEKGGAAPGADEGAGEKAAPARSSSRRSSSSKSRASAKAAAANDADEAESTVRSSSKKQATGTSGRSSQKRSKTELQRKSA